MTSLLAARGGRGTLGSIEIPSMLDQGGRETGSQSKVTFIALTLPTTAGAVFDLGQYNHSAMAAWPLSIFQIQPDGRAFVTEVGQSSTRVLCSRVSRERVSCVQSAVRSIGTRLAGRGDPVFMWCAFPIVERDIWIQTDAFLNPVHDCSDMPHHRTIVPICTFLNRGFVIFCCKTSMFSAWLRADPNQPRFWCETIFCSLKPTLYAFSSQSLSE